MVEVSDPALEPIGAVQRTQVGRKATEPMRADIRLLGTILGDTVREQNGDEVFDLVERARVESFRVRHSRDRPGRDVGHVRRDRHPPGDPDHPGVQPFRSAGQRRRRHPPGAPPRYSRRRRRATARQQPGRHLRQTRSGGTRFGHRNRRPRGRSGLPGHHRPSHRDPPAHRLRHPAPDHPADAAARRGAQRNRRRPQHRNRAAPPGADAVADRADPVVPAEDLRRDRRRAALLRGGVVRGDPQGQRRSAGGVAGPLARHRTARRAHRAARLLDRGGPRRQSQRDRRCGPAGHRQRRIHRAVALPRRTHRTRTGTVDVGAADHRHCRGDRAGRHLPGRRSPRRAVPAGAAGHPRPANRDREPDLGPRAPAPARPGPAPLRRAGRTGGPISPPSTSRCVRTAARCSPTIGWPCCEKASGSSGFI